MRVTRRQLFQDFAAGVALSAALPAFPDSAFSRTVSSAQPENPSPLIVLSRNENAYGPSQKVIGSMQNSLQFANRYPDPAVRALHERIAASHSVKPEQVVLGCGSGEILSLCASTFLGPGKKLITGLPTFEAIGRCSKTVGASVLEVPLTKDYAHDLNAMLALADSSTGLIYICNPNNPTATLTPRKSLESFVSKLPDSTTVLMDEAYHDFVEPGADYASFIDHPADDGRVIASRTFSKVYGLAGIRVGYAVGSPEKIKALAARRLAEGVNAVGASAALVAYDDLEYVRFSERRNARDRAEFFSQAKSRGIPVIPSQTNFAMLQANRPATQVIEYFRRNNIAVARLFPSMSTHVRVSFGTPDQMKEFWRVWDAMPASSAS